MNSVHLSELRPHSYLNLDGEIITKEQAEAMIASGECPILYTVTDDHIQAALDDLSRARKEGREPQDYTAPDLGAQRVLY